MLEKIAVGKVEIIALLDMPMELPWGFVFPNLDITELEAYRSLYPASFGVRGLATQAGAYVVLSAGKTIIVDTGLGPGPIEFLGGARGRLLDDMRDKGVDPESIDLVVHTHLHADHVGWNIDANGSPNFPNARYMAPQGDWDFFNKVLDSNPQMQQIIPLNEMGRVDLISGEVKLTDDVRTYPTPGHTPGHMSVLITSGGEKALVAGDVAHHPAQMDRTDWSPAFDTDGAVSASTRKAIAEMIEADGMTAAFCHFPEPFGRIVKLEGKRVFRAL
jgi:glyoxylase-like metal-dependent hydrolase (beta-lactamase superfamily II)